MDNLDVRQFADEISNIMEEMLANNAISLRVDWIP